jgi:hydroxymethylpyrimidine pyrophosphatase-like HAD family hydrolase
MRLRVIALDDDGTIAEDGRIHPSIPPALAAARAQGLFVALVTGRRLNDLRTVMGDLRIFDTVVAENGAVIASPRSGRSVRHAPRFHPASSTPCTRPARQTPSRGSAW